MKDLKDGNKFCSSIAERIPSSGARFQEKDTLFARITPCLENGKICQVRGLKNGIGFGSTEFLVFRGKENISDNDFVFYLSRWDDVRNFAENNFEGSSGRQRVNKNCFDNLILTVPPLSEQKSIAETLNSLDDKIDLLHRQNKTIEKLAQTLFRKWFIEEVGEDWEEKSLRDIATHYKESINPSKKPDTIFHHYSLPAFDDGKNPVLENGKEILSSKYKVVPNSILVSKLNPRFPRIWALYGNNIADNSICSTEFQIARPINISCFGFIYYFLKSHRVTQELANASSGTSGSHQRVNPDDIFNLSLLMPPKKLIEKFDAATKDNLEKIESNVKQIKTLTHLRDTLLPKLMSGEVRIN
jgi:type I restriction enzyme S subunit